MVTSFDVWGRTTDKGRRWTKSWHVGADGFVDIKVEEVKA